MKPYKEMLQEVEDENRNRIRMAQEIDLIYKTAEEIVKKVEEWDYGTVNDTYWHGCAYVTLRLKTTKGLHPIRTALIIVDELLSNNEDLELVYEPEGIPEDAEDLSWRFKDRSFPQMSLYFEVQLRVTAECRQVGTGRFKEIIEWRCI